MTSHTPVAAWQRQLEQTVAPYVDLALSQHARLQVVLTMDDRGRVDTPPKVTISNALDKGGNGE